jgi:hypothetical protein
MLRSDSVVVKEVIFVSVGVGLNLLVLLHQMGLLYHPLVMDNYGLQMG